MVEIATDFLKLPAKEARRHYSQNFYDFVRTVLHYDKLVIGTHGPLCNFVINTPGDGSSRTTNGPMKDVISMNHPVEIGSEIRRVAVFIPREAFKSTILTVGYTIFRAVHNPYLRFSLTGFNEAKIGLNVREIREHFDQNDDLIKLYGSMSSRKRGGLWSNRQLQFYDPWLKKLIPTRTMPNVMLLGLGSGAATGSHPNVAICDDMVIEENSQTPDGLEKPIAHLQRLEPMVTKGGEIFVVGTFYDHRDAYINHIIKNGQYDVFLRAAIDDNNVLFFPEGLSRETLAKKEVLMGPYRFSCQYMLDPVPPDEAVFKEAWIKQAEVDPGTAPKSLFPLDTRQYVDPAATTNKRSNYSAQLVASKDSNGTLWVRYSSRQHIKDEELLNSMITIYQEYDVSLLQCEQTVGFALIDPLLRRVMIDRKISVNYKAWDLKNKRSKPERIRAMYYLFQAGRIKIPKDHYDLLRELRRYRGRPQEEDDLLDALSMACEDLYPIKEEIAISPQEILAKQISKVEHDEGYEERQLNRYGSRDVFRNCFM